MSKVYIVKAKRSPLGKFLGALSTVPPAELAGQVIKSVVEEAKIDPAKVDEVILGNILSAGHGQNVARQASILGGIPAQVPAYGINILCGSGMKTVMTGFGQIKAGLADMVLAGGVEVMSQSAFVVDGKTRQGNKMGAMEMKDSLLHDGLTDAFNNYHMGVTAENIVEKYNISRESQDRLAIGSQEKAIKAVDSGRFNDEITPIEVKSRRETIIVSQDEYPNRATNFEKLSSLRAAFKKDGTVTAGNASGINDGATILLLASEKAVKEYNLTPMVEIVSIGQGGVDPQIMGMGPVPAINQAIEKSEISMKDIELIELNEAFAAQALGVREELKAKHGVDDNWFEERTNVNGGAIALGHPLGASGGRIITTLVHEMKKRDLTYGLASLCIGGGMGTAVIVKNVK